MIAGSVAAADAFIQQRGLQDVCDGAAAAAAASGVDLGRGGELSHESALRFADVDTACAAVPGPRPVPHRGARRHANWPTTPHTLTLTCRQTEPIAFGAMFGQGAGVRHVVTSSARAPISLSATSLGEVVVVRRATAAHRRPAIRTRVPP